VIRRVVATALLAIGFLPHCALAQRGEGSDSRAGERGENRRPNDDEQPLTPGFGEVSNQPAVPGFGITAADAGGSRNQGVPLADRFHPSVVAYVDQVLRRLDRNGDRKLSREEWSATRWRSEPAESDVNKDGVLTREELCERVKTYDEFRGLSSSTGSSGGSSSAPASDKARLDEYAKGLMKRYDKNENGVLEAEEYGEMSSFHRGADANGDNVITRDELAVRLANYGSSGGSSSSENSSGGSGGESKRDDRRGGSSSSGRSYTTRGPYRPKSATERLPKGLPDWFARNDADGDGQISMAEFAVSWTDDKVEEFAEHDANGDGVITPREVLSDRSIKTSNKPTENPTERSRDWRSRGR
jgi:Ca2+-binding EF-hand superfamily protein